MKTFPVCSASKSLSSDLVKKCYTPIKKVIYGVLYFNVNCKNINYTVAVSKNVGNVTLKSNDEVLSDESL
jgi:hypothetical protein